MPKILLVEDNPLHAEIVIRLLHLQKYEVVAASDAPTGVSLAVSVRPDLILMDMQCPNLGDGQQATRQIRAQPGMETVPIIALTGQCMPQEQAEMYQAGCTDIVTKPFDFKQFLAKVTTLLTTGTKT
jgi:CheY-like chemotaxis protein